MLRPTEVQEDDQGTQQEEALQLTFGTGKFWSFNWRGVSCQFNTEQTRILVVPYYVQ
jgi:hypothetical protein